LASGALAGFSVLAAFPFLVSAGLADSDAGLSLAAAVVVSEPFSDDLAAADVDVRLSVL
jgi:hypothetical protein